MSNIDAACHRLELLIATKHSIVDTDSIVAIKELIKEVRNLTHVNQALKNFYEKALEEIERRKSNLDES